MRYQIEDPNEAIRQIDDIEKTITEIAEFNISQIVSHHTLAEFTPAKVNVGQSQQVVDEHGGISGVIHELTANITKQLQKLGISLLNIGITSWSIKDEPLAHELAQGAVIQAQAQSKMISVEREAAIKDISTKAEASAILTLAASEAEAAVIRAEGDAQALELKGKAIKKVAEQFATDPVGQNIYVNILQADVAKHAKNLNLSI